MTSQPPPDPYGQQQPDPYGSSTPPPPGAQPQYPTSPGQYPPPGAGYGTPPPAPGGTTNTMAIVSLVLSLAGLAVWISAPVGAVLGHVARRQIRERGEQGDGMALAGIIIGWVITGLGILACCGFILLIIAAENSS